MGLTCQTGFRKVLTATSVMLLVAGIVSCNLGDRVVDADVPYVSSNDKVVRNYYSNGQLMLEYESDNGTRNGWFRNYYPDGQLHTDGQFIDTQRVDTFRSYTPTGELASLDVFVNDTLVFERLYWTDLTQLKLVEYESYRFLLVDDTGFVYLDRYNKLAPSIYDTIYKEGFLVNDRSSGVWEQYIVKRGQLISFDRDSLPTGCLESVWEDGKARKYMWSLGKRELIQ